MEYQVKKHFRMAKWSAAYTRMNHKSQVKRIKNLNAIGDALMCRNKKNLHHSTLSEPEQEWQAPWRLVLERLEVEAN